VPTISDQHEGCDELGDRGTDVADTKDSGVPCFSADTSGHTGDAHRKGEPPATPTRAPRSAFVIGGGVGSQVAAAADSMTTV
jgi:hypothetical protein